MKKFILLFATLSLLFQWTEVQASAWDSDFLSPPAAPKPVKVYQEGSFAKTLHSYIEAVEKGRSDILRDANWVAIGLHPAHPPMERDPTPDECDLFARLTKLNVGYAEAVGKMAVGVFGGLETSGNALVNRNLDNLQKGIKMALDFKGLNTSDWLSGIAVIADPIQQHIQKCIRRLYESERMEAFVAQVRRDPDYQTRYEERRAVVMERFKAFVNRFDAWSMDMYVAQKQVEFHKALGARKGEDPRVAAVRAESRFYDEGYLKFLSTLTDPTLTQILIQTQGTRGESGRFSIYPTHRAFVIRKVRDEIAQKCRAAIPALQSRVEMMSINVADGGLLAAMTARF